jgi:hypothetical protein
MKQNTPMHAHQTPDEASETLKLAPVLIALKSWVIEIHFNSESHNKQQRDLPRSHWLQGTEKKETGSRTLCANVYFANSPGGEGVQDLVVQTEIFNVLRRTQDCQLKSLTVASSANGQLILSM